MDNPLVLNSAVVGFSDQKINATVSFYNSDNELIGALDFSGSELIFTGNADESAKMFIDFVVAHFKNRLSEEVENYKAKLKSGVVE